MKTPKFLSKLSAILTPRPRKKLQATARAIPRAALDDYDADEPTTKLSNAFIVVFALHVVAIGGIYTFNSIKEARVAQQPAPVAPTEKKPAAPAEVKPPVQTGAPVTHPVETAALAPVPALSNTKTNTTSAGRQHIVKAGENPTKIAIAYGLKTDELLAANNLKEGAILQPGQTLTIPTPKPAVVETKKPEVVAKQTDVPPTHTTPGLHIIKKGDTATSIAKGYSITADELLKYNKIADAKKLQLGQALKIPPKKS